MRTWPTEHRFRYAVRTRGSGLLTAAADCRVCHTLRYVSRLALLGRIRFAMRSWTWTTRLLGSRGCRRGPAFPFVGVAALAVRWRALLPTVARSATRPLAPQPDCLTAQEARAIAGTAGPVRWLSFPRSMGYEQNPISVYYCYGAGAGRGRPSQSWRACRVATRVGDALRKPSDPPARPPAISAPVSQARTCPSLGRSRRCAWRL